MAFNFTVSPDFNPKHMAGWFIFNTWLQRSLSEPIHLEMYNDFDSQRQAISADKVDLIYANPFDASVLVRKKGFLPVARPKGKSDEAVIAVSTESPINDIEELQHGIRISSTDDPDVHMMCMIMLEPANLNSENTIIDIRDTYILVAKDLISGKADIGFFLEETYLGLSNFVRQQLHPLTSTQIQVISHLILIGPKMAHRRDDMQNLLLNMEHDAKGQGVLQSLEFTSWEAQDDEDAEFMIDLMDTLVRD